MHRANKRLIERSVFVGACLVVMVDLASWYARRYRGQELSLEESDTHQHDVLSTKRKSDRATLKEWRITVGQHEIVDG
jgi:hypothetical protein